MSFYKEIKEYLVNLPLEDGCCKTAFDCGVAGDYLAPECEEDVGCFLRGVFVSRGYTAGPGKNYELTLRFDDEFTFYVNAVLESIALEAKVGRRKDRYILYYKDSESIEDFLSIIGASKYALVLMEQKVINELRENANRMRNAETANLDRAARAGAEQRRAIEYLIESKEFSKLPAELKECATLRMENPDLSLEQLRWLCDPPISKSGLNHRFVKIIEIANNLKSKKS